MKQGLSRQAMATGLIVAALLAPLVAIGLFGFQKHQWATQRLAELEPRFARLVGLEASLPELQQAQGAAQAHLARFTYPTTRDVAQTGNEAHQRVRNVANVAGLTIVSSQVLPPKAEGQFDRIPLVMRLEGELGSLQAVLVVLANEAPIIHVEALSMKTIGAVKAEVPQRLDIQLNLFVLRARP